MSEPGIVARAGGGKGIVPRVRAGKLFERDWDAIVIGSGVGGLVCASLLATRASMRVLVLERHYAAGGLTQTFKRRRFAWEVGVHYLGELAPGSMLRRVYDVTTGGSLAWARLPERHDRLVAPGFDARFGGDRASMRAQWLAHAPGEERAVDRLLGEIEACARAAPQFFLGRMGESGVSPRADRSPFLAWADRTSAEVLAEAGASPRLAALLSYTWTDYGAPPERSSFAALAVTTAHYFGGAFYPEGGGGRIADALATTIASHGGAVVVRAGVEEILVRDGRARGVRLEDGRELLAPIVISNAGARATFDELVREPTEMRARMRALGASDSHVGLYVGFRKTPQDLGLDGANLWLRRDPLDDDAPRDADAWAEGGSDLPPDLFVSTGCAIDPAFAERFPGRAAITAAVAVRYASFAKWAGTSHADRGAEYAARKEALGRGILRLLERHVPLDAIEHVEVSTPLSTAHFGGRAHGEVYGLDPTPTRFRHGPRPHTPIAGLFLTGQDVWMCGVGGAASSGLLTACAVTKRDFARELAMR